MTQQQTRAFLGKAERVAQRNVRKFVTQARTNLQNRAAAGQSVESPARTRSIEPVLGPATALRENGFTVFQGLFTQDECAKYGAALKTEAKISAGKKYTKVDAASTFPTARDLLFEGRIVDAVRSALGAQPRFLQVADLHYLHDTSGWHRDSVHRAHDASEAPDWTEDEAPYGVVKAILYMESQNAAMGIMAGSHLSPIEMDFAHVKQIEDAGRQRIIDLGENPNLRLSAEQKRTPLAWHAGVGDVLVFDERMYHAGRRVDAGAVTQNREAAKFTLSLVFGRDNEHSERLYAYFRYLRRDLPYRDLAADFAAELARRDLVLDRGWTDRYREQPDGLKHVHLPDPTKLEALLAEYGAPTKV